MPYIRCNPGGNNADYFQYTDYPTGNGSKSISFGKTFKVVPMCYVSSSMGSIKIRSVTTTNVTYDYSAGSSSTTISVRILAYVT